MFCRPVKRGWKPVPSSRRLATRPLSCTLPRVGSIVPVMILRSVDLPAPLTPIMPTELPPGTSKDIAHSATTAVAPGREDALDVDDRRGPEEDLEEHAHHLRRVAHEDVEHRGEHAEAEREGELEGDERQPEEQRRVERMPRQRECEQEDGQREQ